MDLKELFESINSEVLTDEVKLKISTLFESAVTEAAKAKETELEEKNKSEITEFKEELTEQVDAYLNYFTEEYMNESKDIIHDAVVVEKAKKVLCVFDALVEKFNMELSDEKVENDEEVEKLKVKLESKGEELEKTISELKTMKKEKLIIEKSEKLESDISREKFTKIAGSINFISDEDFGKKLDVIAESLTEKKEEKLEKKEEEKIDLNEKKNEEDMNDKTGTKKYISLL